MTDRNIYLCLAYDGTNYHGWQEQVGQLTVQSVLEKALQKVHHYPVKAIAAGRTDAGVHAEGQVVNFTSSLHMPAENFTFALNAVLPKDIRIYESSEVPSSFHARHSARSRIYQYRIYTGEICPPKWRSYTYCIHRIPKVNILNNYLRCLIGTHDFSSFAGSRDVSKNKCRNITEAVAYTEGPFIIIHIKGNAFLYRMVRTIVGTVLDLEKNDTSKDKIIKILQSRDRTVASETAPPWGLTLLQVEYT